MPLQNSNTFLEFKAKNPKTQVDFISFSDKKKIIIYGKVLSFGICLFSSLLPIDLFSSMGYFSLLYFPYFFNKKRLLESRINIFKSIWQS